MTEEELREALERVAILAAALPPMPDSEETFFHLIAAVSALEEFIGRIVAYPCSPIERAALNG